MPEIIMCPGYVCPRKTTCYRFLAPHYGRQDFFGTQPLQADGSCEHYWAHLHIGNQSAFTAWPLTAPFAFACDHGFDAFEWFPDKRSDGTGWASLDFLAPDREIAFKNGRARQMAISLHASIAATPMSEVGRQILQQDIALARDIGATLLNLHVDLAAGVGPFIIQLQPILVQLYEVNITLTLENTVFTMPQQINELFAGLQEKGLLQEGRAGLCLDIGHANLCSTTHNDYIAFLDQLDKHIPVLHIHLHENWGDADSHLLVFTGPAGQNAAGIRALFKRLGQRSFVGSVILEQWPSPPQGLAEARNKLQDLIHEVFIPPQD